MLSDEEKSKIRLEEIYRDEVRATLTKKSSNKVIAFLNTNFGLFILSTVLVGFISFLYTNWDSAKTNARNNSEKIESLTDEVLFRINQIDKAFSIVKDNYAILENKNQFLGKNINNYLTSTEQLCATCKLAGIISFPPSLTEETIIWVGSSGFSQRNIPYKRGFKNQDYQFMSLKDLLKRINSLNDNLVEVDKIKEFEKRIVEFDNLSEYSQTAILSDWFSREQANPPYDTIYNPAYSINEKMVNDYGDSIRKVAAWHQLLHAKWTSIKESDILVKNISD